MEVQQEWSSLHTHKSRQEQSDVQQHVAYVCIPRNAHKGYGDKVAYSWRQSLNQDVIEQHEQLVAVGIVYPTTIEVSVVTPPA